jgi:hypothetical protein
MQEHSNQIPIVHEVRLWRFRRELTTGSLYYTGKGIEVDPDDLDASVALREWCPARRALRDPAQATLDHLLAILARKANGAHRVRRVRPPSTDPVFQNPHGLLEDKGAPPEWEGSQHQLISTVGVAWFTLGGVKYVRPWSRRRHLAYRPQCGLFIPAPSDRMGLHVCWGMTFPRRFSRLRERRAERVRRILDRIGPPGGDDRVNLALRVTRIRAHVPGVGVVLTDNLARPRLVQVVVRDPSTGLRHHISVPPRFGNPAYKTFQKLGTSASRIRAALAWTFDLKPEEYDPALEA